MRMVAQLLQIMPEEPSGDGNFFVIFIAIGLFIMFILINKGFFDK